MKQLTGQSLDDIMHNKIFQKSHLLGVCKLAKRSPEVAPSISFPFYFGEVNVKTQTQELFRKRYQTIVFN